MVFRKSRNDDEGFADPSIIQQVINPFLAAKDWFADALHGDDSIRTSEGSAIVRFITLPIRLLWAFAVFMVQAWTTSRSGIAFLRGLPAIGGLAFALGGLWLFSTYMKQITLGPTFQYHTMHRTNSPDNPEYALMFSKKLVELRPDDLEVKFMMAEDIASTGDIDHATRLMEYLATATGSEEGQESGIANAHVWLSRILQREQAISGADPEKTKAALGHLEKAIEQDSENVMAKITLANLYLAESRKAEPESPEYKANLEKARDSLLDLTSREFTRLEQVMAMPQLVDIFVKLGDEKAAGRALNNAVGRVATIARLNPEVFEVWLSLVQSAVALKKYDQANEFIREGYQSVQTDETRKKIVRLASLVHLQNADDFVSMNTERSYRMRLFALCRAIQANPRDAAIYQRLLDFVDVEFDADKPEREVWLRDSILPRIDPMTGDKVECPIPGIVHLLIGVRQLAKGDVVQGQKHWRIGQQHFETSEMVIHRLISVASQREKGFPRIGEIVTLAIEFFPDQPMLYETRGAMLKEEGRYSDALSDFEIVLEKLPNLLTVHKHVADCYRQLSQPDKAAYHDQRVREILDQLNAEERELYQQMLEGL